VQVVARCAAHERDERAGRLVGAARHGEVIGREAVAEQEEHRVLALLARALARGIRGGTGQLADVVVRAVDVAYAEAGVLAAAQHHCRAAVGHLGAAGERPDGGRTDHGRRRGAAAAASWSAWRS